MKKLDITNVQEAGDFIKLSAGAYICKITKVEDFPAKEYLKVTYDIAQGEFAGHFDSIRKDHADWAWVGAYVKSYKPTALPMFKRFCSAVSKSNAGYVFDGNINADEKTLVGKLIGITLGEEEYYGNDGEKKTRLYVSREFPIDQIGKQKVPALKTLKDEPANDFTGVPTDIDLPFK